MKKLLMVGLVALSTAGVNKANASSAVEQKVRASEVQRVVAATATKLNWFWNVDVECNSDGGAGIVKRFLGIPVVREKVVPNSALCQ